MEKDSVTFTIFNCGQCPHHHKERHYTADSFETEFAWKCAESNDRLLGYLDWHEQAPRIPSWCPLRNEQDREEIPLSLEQQILEFLDCPKDIDEIVSEFKQHKSVEVKIAAFNIVNSGKAQLTDQWQVERIL